MRAPLLPAIYVEGVDAAGGHSRIAAAAAPSTPRSPTACWPASTAWCSPAAPTSTPRATAQQPHIRDRRRRAATATPGSSRCCAARWPPACRCSASAGGAGAQRGAGRHAAPAPARRRSGTTSTSRAPRCSPRRRFTTVPGTPAGRHWSATSEAQCYHHQAIDRLGDGLTRHRAGRRRHHRGRGGRPGARLGRSACSGTRRKRLDDLRLFRGSCRPRPLPSTKKR